MADVRPLAVVHQLPTTVDAPRTARVVADETLCRLGARARARREDLALVVSELVTNAVLHGPQGDLKLRLIGTKSTMRVEVSDDGTEPFEWPTETVGESRGLQLVSVFADRAGVMREPSTVVWCELDLEKPTAR